MKVALIFLATVLAMAAAQGGHGEGGLHDLIRKEVHALLQADSSLTVDQCSTKCDSLFDLVESHDEQHTDAMCHMECDCQVNHNCNHHHHPHQPNAPSGNTN